MLFKNKNCIIYDPCGAELIKVKMRNRVFSLELNKLNFVDKALSTSVDESALWHRRLGHFSYGSLIKMHAHDLVDKLPAISESNSICEVCDKGKQKRKSFSAGQ